MDLPMDLPDPVLLAQLLIDGLLAGALYALLACGLNLVFGVMQVINLAHGELMLLGAFLAWLMYDKLGWHPLLALPFVAPIAFALGALLQRHLVERVIGKPLLTSLLLTYAVSIILVNAGLYVFTADYRSVPVMQGSMLLGDLAIPKPRAAAGLVSVIITGAVYLFLQRSRLGKAIRATAEHPQVAAICGINVQKMRMLTLGLAAVMAAWAGVMLAMIYSFSPESGADFMLKSFAVIVLGGMGSFIGAFYGALLLGIAEAYVGFFVSTQWAEATAYLLLVAVLLLWPSGVTGRRDAR
jgi:branched-chain amino acid transport system permease protein